MAGREEFTTSIGGFTYKMHQLGGLEGRKVFQRFIKMLAAGGIVLAPEEDFEYMCNKFAPLTSVSGGAYGSNTLQLDVIFDSHFAGKYDDMCKWLTWSMKEVNFSSFLATSKESDLQGVATPGV